MFGLPGDQTMHALDGLYDEPSIQFVTTRHEQGTTYLADGYARGGGRPGVAFVVPGVGRLQRRRRPRHRVRGVLPGRLRSRARSTATASARGWVCCTRSHDQLDLVRPITTWQRRALHADEIPETVHEAFVRVQRGRRQPVEIEMPPEAFSEEADVTLLRSGRGRARAGRPRADRRAPPTLLAAASDPLVWAGGGVVLGDASRRAHRGGRAPAGAGGHDAPGQGRGRRPAPARRRIGRGSTAGCSRCSTTPT